MRTCTIILTLVIVSFTIVGVLGKQYKQETKSGSAKKHGNQKPEVQSVDGKKNVQTSAEYSKKKSKKDYVSGEAYVASSQKEHSRGNEDKSYASKRKQKSPKSKQGKKHSVINQEEIKEKKDRSAKQVNIGEYSDVDGQVYRSKKKNKSKSKRSASDKCNKGACGEMSNHAKFSESCELLEKEKELKSQDNSEKEDVVKVEEKSVPPANKEQEKTTDAPKEDKFLGKEMSARKREKSMEGREAKKEKHRKLTSQKSDEDSNDDELLSKEIPESTTENNRNDGKKSGKKSKNSREEKKSKKKGKSMRLEDEKSSKKSEQSVSVEQSVVKNTLNNEEENESTP